MSVIFAPQAPSVLASSGSSEEDLLANWQRMFVEKTAPTSDGSVVHRTSFSSQSAQELQRRRQAAGPGVTGASSDRRRATYSDGEEGSSARSWTPSRGSSLDTDTDTEPRSSRRGRYGADGSVGEGERLLMDLEDDGGSGDTAVTVATSPADTHREELVDEGGGARPRRETSSPMTCPSSHPASWTLTTLLAPPPCSGPRRARRGWGSTTCTAKTV